MEHNPHHSEDLLANELALSNHARFLKKHGMYSAALYFKNMNEPLERRAARATRYAFETLPAPEYTAGCPPFLWTDTPVNHPIPGDDPNGCGFRFLASGNFLFEAEKFGRLREQCTNSVEEFIVDSILNDCRAASITPSRGRYNHGGIHNVVDFDFVLQNGISAYRSRILQAMESTDDPQVRLFEEGMLDILAGIEIYMQRYVAALEETAAAYPGDKTELNRLIRTLKKVPLQPAESFYEAFTACCAAMFFSGCYEPGRIDDYLFPYYEKDLAAGKTSEAEAYALIRALLEDIERNTPHPGVTHVTIGGTNHGTDEPTEEFLALVKSEESRVAAIFAGHLHYDHAGEFAPGRMQYVSAPAFTRFVREVSVIPA